MKSWHVAGADADLEGAVMVGLDEEEGVSADGEAEVGEVRVECEGEAGLLGVDQAGCAGLELEFPHDLPAEDVLDAVSAPCHSQGRTIGRCGGHGFDRGVGGGRFRNRFGDRGGGPAEVEAVVFGMEPEIEAGDDGPQAGGVGRGGLVAQ